MAPKRVLLLSGPNGRMLGRRQPGIYGSRGLDYLEELVQGAAGEFGIHVTIEQIANPRVLDEGVIIEAIHRCMDDYDGLIINPGGYTHTSVSILDALSMLSIPIIEVHISKGHAREEFRRSSMMSPVCNATIMGAGLFGYVLALRHLDHLFRSLPPGP